MADDQPIKEETVEKKKSGKVLAFFLGMLMGIIFLLGALGGVGYYIWVSPIEKAVNIADKFVAKDLNALLFGSGEEKYECGSCGYVHTGALPEGFTCPNVIDENGTVCGHPADHFMKVSGLLDAKYTELKVGNLLADLILAVDGVKTGTLNSFNDISPSVEEFVVKLLIALDKYAVPVDKATLMAQPVNKLGSYLKSSFKKTPLGDCLQGFESEKAPSALMLAISYGEENVDYKVGADGEIQMLGDATKTLIGDLLTDEGMDGILNNAPLDAAIKNISVDDGTMCTIAYGSDERWDVKEIDGVKTVVMNPAPFTLSEGVLYDEDNVAVNATYDATAKTLTYASGNVLYLKAVDGETNVFNAYYDANFTEYVPYRKTRIGDLSNGSAEIIDDVYLKDALNITDSSHKALQSLAYAKDGTPRTIADLKNDGSALITGIAISDVLDVDTTSATVMYMLYGKEGIHWKKGNDKTEAILLQKKIAIVDGETAVYNGYGELLTGYIADTTAKTFTDDSGNTYRYEDLPADDDTLKKTVKTVTDPAKEATLYHVTDADGNPIMYEEHTLNDLSGENNLLSKLTTRLTVTDLFGETEASENFFLKHVQDETIDTLPSAIEKLTIYEVYKDEIEDTSDTGNGAIWKNYLLKDKSTGTLNKTYTVKDMGALVANMTHNVQNTNLGQLKEDGLISQEVDINIPTQYQAYVSGNKTNLKELTTNELITLVSGIFSAPTT